MDGLESLLTEYNNYTFSNAKLTKAGKRTRSCSLVPLRAVTWNLSDALEWWTGNAKRSTLGNPAQYACLTHPVSRLR